MRAQFRSRIRFILALVVLAAILIIVRLYFVQIVHGDEYADKADRQFASGGSGLFDRGAIYLSNKDGTLISAATLATGFLVAINPQTLTDPESAHTAIAAVASTTISREAFLASSAKKNLVYVEVAHRVTEENGKALAARDIPGVQVLRERWRYYPGSALASQSIGIVSYGSGDELIGQTGLEAVYDGTLSRSGDALYKNFFAELFSNVGNLLVDAKDAREGDVVTTIEPEVQSYLERELAKVEEKYATDSIGGIVMNPKDGSIYAMSMSPNYNPNSYSKEKDFSVFRPAVVDSQFELGSFFKPITMSGGINE